MAKRIVLSTFGSFGDLHPYIAVALELQARGHVPVLATSEIYREKITGAGLEFHPARPALPPLEEAGEMIAKVMDLRSGTEYLFKQILMPALRDSYADLSQALDGADALVTHMLSFTGVMLAQQRGLPWASTALAPISLFSAYDPPTPPIMLGARLLPRLGPSAITTLLRLMKRYTRSWIEPVYQLRAELGLPPGGHPIFEGQHSPQLVLALFSAALGAPQPDWPPHTRQCGFAFYDRKDGAPLHPDLARFLDAGPPPIVFTLGSSAVFDARNFFRDSAAAAQSLGQRAVLLIGDERNRPAPLPPDIVAFDYAPYSEILPRASVIVHQGGAGTTGQALRAGRPMLVMPYSHDQPDHAARIERLGVGHSIPRARYSARRAAAALQDLLKNPTYATRAAVVGRQVRAENGAQAAAAAIEELL